MLATHDVVLRLEPNLLEGLWTGDSPGLEQKTIEAILDLELTPVHKDKIVPRVLIIGIDSGKVRRCLARQGFSDRCSSNLENRFKIRNFETNLLEKPPFDQALC